jgi:hypothetical protein
MVIPPIAIDHLSEADQLLAQFISPRESLSQRGQRYRAL